MNEIPMEPAADMRVLANTIRQVYVALMQEGFNNQQALVIVGQILAGQMKGGAA